MPTASLYPLGLVLHRTEAHWWPPRLTLHGELEIQRRRNLSGRRVSPARLKLANGPARRLSQYPIDGTDVVAFFHEPTLHGTDLLRHRHFSIGAHQLLHGFYISQRVIQTGLAVEAQNAD